MQKDLLLRSALIIVENQPSVHILYFEKYRFEIFKQLCIHTYTFSTLDSSHVRFTIIGMK